MCSRSTWRSRWQPRRAPATAPYGTTRTGSERTIRRPTKPSNTQTAPSKGEASFAAISTPCCLLARLGSRFPASTAPLGAPSKTFRFFADGVRFVRGTHSASPSGCGSRAGCPQGREPPPPPRVPSAPRPTTPTRRVSRSGTRVRGRLHNFGDRFRRALSLLHRPVPMLLSEPIVG